MKDPIALTRAFSEFDGTTDVDIEESPKFVGDWCHMNLKRMQSIIKNFPSGMNEICDNYDFPNALRIGSLIYAILLWLKDIRVGQWAEPCIGLHKRTW